MRRLLYQKVHHIKYSPNPYVDQWQTSQLTQPDFWWGVMRGQ